VAGSVPVGRLGTVGRAAVVAVDGAEYGVNGRGRLS
jgi:hypothetical protein